MESELELLELLILQIVLLQLRRLSDRPIDDLIFHGLQRPVSRPESSSTLLGRQPCDVFASYADVQERLGAELELLACQALFELLSCHARHRLGRRRLRTDALRGVGQTATVTVDPLVPLARALERLGLRPIGRVDLSCVRDA